MLSSLWLPCILHKSYWTMLSLEQRFQQTNGWYDRKDETIQCKPKVSGTFEWNWKIEYYFIYLFYNDCVCFTSNADDCWIASCICHHQWQSTPFGIFVSISESETNEITTEQTKSSSSWNLVNVLYCSIRHITHYFNISTLLKCFKLIYNQRKRGRSCTHKSNDNNENWEWNKPTTINSQCFSFLWIRTACHRKRVSWCMNHSFSLIHFDDKCKNTNRFFWYDTRRTYHLQ